LKLNASLASKYDSITELLTQGLEGMSVLLHFATAIL